MKQLRRQKPDLRVYSEVVDDETFTLQEVEVPDRHRLTPREYVVRRGGELAMGVLRKGTAFYYVYPFSDPRRWHVGYVQHSRRGALLAAALLLTRGLPPPKPEKDEVNLRQMVAERSK